MKVKHIDDSSEEFKPIQLVVTIESQSELIALWHRLNITWQGVKNASHSPPKEIPDKATTTLWNALDQLAKDNRIKLYKPRG